MKDTPAIVKIYGDYLKDEAGFHTRITNKWKVSKRMQSMGNSSKNDQVNAVQPEKTKGRRGTKKGKRPEKKDSKPNPWRKMEMLQMQ